MRKKEDKTAGGFGVADGLDFGANFEESIEENELFEALRQKEEPQPKPQPKIKPAKTEIAEIDPNRCYSKYYSPKPKKGSKGGTLGRGSVDEKERKVQFSLTCTPAQKERFIEASQKDHRKLPDFICVAVEEYIENHGL